MIINIEIWNDILTEAVWTILKIPVNEIKLFLFLKVYIYIAKKL